MNPRPSHAARFARHVVQLGALFLVCLLVSPAFAARGALKQDSAKAAASAEAEEQLAVEFPAGESGRAAYLARSNARFDDTKPIGESRGGWFCVRRGDVFWNKTTYPLLMPIAVMSRRFRAELEKAHFPVPNAPADSIFDEKKESAPEGSANALQVGLLVKQVSVNLCQKGTREWIGDSYLKLYWQVYAPEQKKVVFEVTTEGRFQSGDKPLDSPVEIMSGAFAVAVRNLLAEPGYLKTVMTPMDVSAASAASAAAKAALEKIVVEGSRPTDEPLVQKITPLRAAVATLFSDNGSGTGFYIGKNDLLLTNQHVVGSAKFVKVRLATGREMIGEVLRSDATRDVALVRTEPAGVPPIPVRLTDPKIGDDVFALGSPLGEKFNTTLTRGILGGFRELDHQNYLQSDVALLPGNSGGPLLDATGQVIGIAVMGLGAKGVAGLNFFVPVGEALDKLGLQMSDR